MKVFCEVDRVLRPLKAGRPAKALPSVQTKGIVGFMKTTQVRMMCCLIRIYTRAFMDAPLCARNMIICLGKLHVQRRCVTYMEYRPTYNYLVAHWTTCTAHLQVHVSLRAQYHCTSTMLFITFIYSGPFLLPFLGRRPYLPYAYNFIFCFAFSRSYLIFMPYCILHSITHMEHNYTFPGFWKLLFNIQIAPI